MGPSSYNPNSLQTRQSRRIAAVLARTTASVIYEVPVGKIARVTNITICNTSTSRMTIRLHHVGPGESAAASNALFYDLEMAGNTTITDDSIRSLVPGDRLFAQASSASSVAFLVYGDFE